MDAAVVGQRQLQHVLEIAGQHHLLATMGETIGVERDQHAARDGEEAEADPGGKQRHDVRGSRRRALGLRTDQRVDDATEQNRLGELRGGERHVGKRQQPAQSRFGPQQTENAAVKAEEVHDDFQVGGRPDFSAIGRAGNALPRPQQAQFTGFSPSAFQVNNRN